MERILVVEDDPQLAHLVTAALQHQGYTILLAINGLDAVEMAPQADLMVLDLGLPGLGGLEVIRELREADWNLPILVLSAQGQRGNSGAGLRAGSRRLPHQAHERAGDGRAGAGPPAAQPTHTGNPDWRSAHFAQATPGLPGPTAPGSVPTELDLLLTLAQNPGEVWSRERLLQRVWGAERGSTVDERVVDSYVALLRRKLGDDPKTPRYIETVFGQGYRFVQHT